MMKSALRSLCRLHVSQTGVCHLKAAPVPGEQHEMCFTVLLLAPQPVDNPLMETLQAVGPPLIWFAQRACRLHVAGCLHVLEKDLPIRVSADKERAKPDDTLLDSQSPLQELKLESIFPTLETHGMLINGVRYDELPIIHIKASHNNTIITATDHKGTLTAEGTVGFRNARKGTNIAAQAAAIALAEKAVKQGLNLARICVKGIGPGRLPAVKGLQMSGITVVSITDTTPLPHNGHRPKKQRRL
ncbi:hypothetical protein BaRGS_00011912 [Batillaria attramentaria]|uniref:Ribosomal protein S11 n=1 Tax=Batillaria attramentaria TaxID=370345 RepID=A0ABD0LD91_9CAEN